MAKTRIRALVVDDFVPFRSFVRSILQSNWNCESIFEASDGVEALAMAQELQPDLILLDLGLPKLNGLEVARRIRHLSPHSKLVFLSLNQSREIAEEALRTGALAYVVKLHAGHELLPAVDTVLTGKRFISASLFAEDSSAPLNGHAATITHSHEVAFYADDSSAVDGYARFIKSSLEVGNAVIVVVTESHRASLLPKLEADGVDVPAAVEQGRYIPLSAADTLFSLMVNDMPDPVRCTKTIGDLILAAARGVKGEHARVEVCGEIAPTLLSNGNAEGAIKLERLWDEITRGYGVHTLCGYLSGAFQHQETDRVFERICAEHTVVQSR